MTRRTGLGRIEALILFVLLGGGWLFAAVAVISLRRLGAPSKCSNNLRQLGLAAIQYADDLRFFPHVGPLAQLDGGMDTNASTKLVRALVWQGYHDNPEGFVCPQSYDLHAPITDDAVKTDMKLWFWGARQRGDPELTPFVDGLEDPTLDETDELSFGWTRKAMNANVRSTAPLAADRAQKDPDHRPDDATPGQVGNHEQGANVVHADGTVTWIDAGQEEAARLAEVNGDQAGSLAIRPPLRAGVRPRLEWEGHAATLGPPALLGLLLVALVRRRAPESVGKLVAPTTVVARGPSRVTALPPADVALQQQQRCPLCHGAVVAADALSRCLDCRAVFHADCVAPGSACPTLGCGVAP